MEYISIQKFAILVGKTPQCLRNWDKNGKLKPHHVSISGYRYYTKEQTNIVLGLKQKKDKIVIGYCRVSSKKQENDLQRQIEYVKTFLLSQGNPYRIITDIGSGINYKKKGLEELLSAICAGEVSKVVVLYKDRLLRFGVELISYIASIYDCIIEVIDTTEKTKQEELVEDLTQIITVFSCRLQGSRANKAKVFIKELANDNN